MTLSSDEQWRPIPAWEGYYEASDQGRVRSLDRTITCRNGSRRACRGQLIRTWRTSTDYEMARLHRDGVAVNVAVHRLVLTAHVSPCPEGMEGCHNNGDKTDCTVGNLRWDTRSENASDRVKHGTHQHAKKARCPRGHLLVDPNLVASAKKYGGRHCKACNRAHANVQSAKKRGESYDFVAWADGHYARIMGSTTPVSTAAAVRAS